jgi:hypothetical protein
VPIFLQNVTVRGMYDLVCVMARLAMYETNFFTKDAVDGMALSAVIS